jgi:glutamyl endopeptidase
MVELVSVYAPLEGAEAELPPIVVEGNKGATENQDPGDIGAFQVIGKRSVPLPNRTRDPHLETVIGPDDRILVKETTRFPWRAIAQLEITPQTGKPGPLIGTAWFAGAKTLITAGHCVYDPVQIGGWARSIKVVPGKYGTTAPFEIHSAARFATVDQWLNLAGTEQGYGYDIGCIQLSTAVGEKTGVFAVKSVNDKDLQEQLVNVCGYPVDKNLGTMQYLHANRIKATAPQRVFYDVDTYGGQSGSAVYVLNAPGDVPQAVAIHAYGTGATPSDVHLVVNSGTRLTAVLVEQIKKWITDNP